MTLAAVCVDVGPQYGIHARQMPVALLLKPLQNVAIDAEMNRRFARRHHNACTLPEFGIFLWALGASARVLSLPCAICCLISVSVYLTVVGFLVMLVGRPCADDVNRSMRVAYRAVPTGHNVKLPLLACRGRCIPGLIPRSWWSRGCGQSGNLLDFVRQLFFGRVE